MRKIFRTITHKLLFFIGLLVGIISLNACIADSINIDPDKPREGEMDKDNLWGAFLTTMQRRVMPEDINQFQLVEDMIGNVYSGYFATMNNWESGANSTTYVFPAKYTNPPFAAAYVNFLSSWNVLRQKVDSSSVVFAVGEILKVQKLHRVCDMYGPLPYKKFGIQSPVPYDSQEEVYATFLGELNHAIEILSLFDSQTSMSKTLVDYDLVYASELPNWIKFANSLKLRLAMRIRYVQPQLAKQYAIEAIVKSSYGVITSNEENPTIMSNSKFGFNYQNPIECLWNEYGDDCMGATMDSYMNGYQDPRLPKYFQTTKTGTYVGLRNGYANGTLYRNLDISDPNIHYGDPLRWMTASEVSFLLAEAALLGWEVGGTPQMHYEQGIRLSFEQWGIMDQTIITNYLNNTTNKPQDYKGVLYGLGALPAASTITIHWDESANKNVNLERIITQKWIALYPLGQEAWSEFRRTGFPKIFEIVDNKGTGVDTDIQIRRIPFPESEYTGNETEVRKAIGLLGGKGDLAGTRLWWDVEDKVIN